MGAQALKCTACGAVVTGEGQYCSYCGARLIIPQPATHSPQEDLEKQLIALLKEGNFLQAVKLYKDYSGKGLRESKEHIDQLADKQGIQRPKGCFVATACYGDYNAPEVRILRRYRDEHLQATFPGRAFARFYYFTSPPFARILGASGLLRKFARRLLLGPIVKKLREKYRY